MRESENVKELLPMPGSVSMMIFLGSVTAIVDDCQTVKRKKKTQLLIKDARSLLLPLPLAWPADEDEDADADDALFD